MAVTIPVEARIMDAMRSYQRVGVKSATSDTLSNVLHISRRDIRPALERLMKAGAIEYAKKAPGSVQARYRLKGRP
ncbi:MAG TPA: hypothetical protein VGE05_15545 [Novosphingobium sp.]